LKPFFVFASSAGLEPATTPTYFRDVLTHWQSSNIKKALHILQGL
jgi:hypothetical protein